MPKAARVAIGKKNNVAGAMKKEEAKEVRDAEALARLKEEKKKLDDEVRSELAKWREENFRRTAERLDYGTAPRDAMRIVRGLGGKGKAKYDDRAIHGVGPGGQEVRATGDAERANMFFNHFKTHPFGLSAEQKKEQKADKRRAKKLIAKWRKEVAGGGRPGFHHLGTREGD